MSKRKSARPSTPSAAPKATPEPVSPAPEADETTKPAQPAEPEPTTEPGSSDATLDGATSTDRPRGPAWLGRWLPWGLVAALSIACVVLATLYGDAREQMHTLQGASASAVPSASSAAATSGPAPITAAPTTGNQAAQILALQRRDATDPRALGKVDAPIVLIEWADFRCPYCAAWYQQTLPQLLPYVKSGSVRIEFHDLVIFGDESQAVAQAARAAGMQGHFWDFSSQVWALHTGNGHPEISDQMIQELATKAGVADLDKFNSDRASAAVVDAVKADTTQATQMGLQGTPFFLINTTQLPGAYPAATFVNVIEQYGGKKA